MVEFNPYSQSRNEDIDLGIDLDLDDLDSVDELDNSAISERLNNDDNIFYLRFNNDLNSFEEHKNRLNRSYKELRKVCPRLFENCERDGETEWLLNKILPDGFLKDFYFTNLTFEQDDKPVKILAFRILQEGAFLQEVLPKGMTLSFRGHVDNFKNYFVINEVRLVADVEPLSYEVKINAQVKHVENYGVNDKFLRHVLENAKSLANYTRSRLIEWEDYLKWRRELVARKIAGCKYIGVDFIQERETVQFTLLTEGEDAFKKFKRFLRKDIKAFENNYSRDKWIFDFDADSRKRNNPVNLGRYKRIVEAFLLNDSLEEVAVTNSATINDDYNYEFEYDEYDQDDFNDNIQENEKDPYAYASKNFENPYIVKVEYELTNEQKDYIEENNLVNEEKERYIEEILNNFEKQGFLALSGVGDFVLIKRLERAIDDLKRDNSISANLAMWLFDIGLAGVPVDESYEEIIEWLNPNIKSNENQMEAVEKMLNIMDIGLIQGPPGTGKTTVIAEIIYQYVKRNKRVLIASQSNDAVDNALERLVDNPSIRALRLGQKNRKKRLVDEDLKSKFTEENAMRTFYNSVSKSLSDVYIDRWKETENLEDDYRRDLRDTSNFIADIASCRERINKFEDEKMQVQNKLIEAENTLKRVQQEEREFEILKFKLQSSIGFIDRQEGRMDVPKSIIQDILTEIQTLLGNLNEKGIVLDAHQFMNIQYIDENQQNNLLQLIIDNARCFSNLVEKFKSLNSSNTETPEVLILRNKFEEIKEKISEYDEDDDMALMEMIRERKRISAKINELSSSVNSHKLSKREETIFDSMILRNQYLKDGNLIVDKFKVFLVNNEEDVLDLLEKIKSVLVQNLKAERAISNDTNELEKSVDRCKAQISNISETIRENKEIRTNLKNQLAKLLEKYEVSDISEVEDKIDSLIEENNVRIRGQKTVRDSFEDLIVTFKSKLDDEDAYKYDKKFYERTYLEACNVVGISCTDDMRVLGEKGYNDFDLVIIDEVSKATPPELLIPLMRGKKVILVGDHRQLPPLFNEHEKSYEEMIESKSDIEDNDELSEVDDLLTRDNFNRFRKMVTASLFKEYFEEADERIKHSLLTQYRMHSDISSLINRFYEGRLVNGLDEINENKFKNHDLRIPSIDGSKFITTDKHAYWLDSTHLPNGEFFPESRPKGSTSTENILECYMIIELLKKMAKEYSAKGYTQKNPKEIGVISFYQIQVNRLKRMLKDVRKAPEFKALRIDINTVDRFQGKEKPIIITSLVRNVKNYKASEKSHIAAFERINVAFSRAQEMLVIVGSAQMYKNQPVKLPKMDEKGAVLTSYVYQSIIEELDRKASYFTTTKILDVNKCAEIKEYMKKEYR